MDERRLRKRWSINQRAELTVENGVRAIPCMVEDISQGGMRICLNRELFEEVFTNFKLALAELELNLGANVVRREQQYEKNIYALCFNRISDLEKEELEKYVQGNFRDLMLRHWWEDKTDAGTQEPDQIAD